MYGQYDDLFFSGRGFGNPVFLKPHFGHPVKKILAKTLFRGICPRNLGPDVKLYEPWLGMGMYMNYQPEHFKSVSFSLSCVGSTVGAAEDCPYLP